MSQSTSSRRVFMRSLLAATATAGAVATFARSASAASSVCEIGTKRACWKWKQPPLTPRPDKPNTKQK